MWWESGGWWLLEEKADASHGFAPTVFRLPPFPLEAKRGIREARRNLYNTLVEGFFVPRGFPIGGFRF